MRARALKNAPLQGGMAPRWARGPCHPRPAATACDRYSGRMRTTASANSNVIYRTFKNNFCIVAIFSLPMCDT